MKIVLRWHGASFCASKIDPARVTSYQGNSSYPLFLPKRLCGTKSCVWTSAHCAIVGSTSLHGMIFSELRSYAERSEEHTSELQSRLHLVCRLLLEKKNRDQGK